MDGPVILRRLVTLSRSHIRQIDPTHDFDGADRRIRSCGRTNGRAFNLPRSILGVKIPEVLGYRDGANPSRPHHSVSETYRKYSDIPIWSPEGRNAKGPITSGNI